MKKAKQSHVDQLIRLALREDIGRQDLTTRLLIRPTTQIEAVIRAEEKGVLCGVSVARQVFRMLDPRVRFKQYFEDGHAVQNGADLIQLKGPARPILSGERTALNFLSRLCGVATLTQRYVREVAGTKARIMDTRKTTPGWRTLEKYAVRVGGGTNHRMGLWDALLVKENHLRILASDGGKVTGRLRLIRRITSHLRKRASRRLLVEVEVENMDEFREALEARPKIILLDNMGFGQIRQAVRLARQAARGDKRVLLEVSGGVRLNSVRDLARAGVDRISVGALTHSARSLDLSLEVK